VRETVCCCNRVLCETPHELSAETVEPCQVNFVARHYFLGFLKEYPDACFKVAELLSEKYRIACNEVRWLGLSRTADQRLAKLLLEWSHKKGETSEPDGWLERALTLEEIGQLIGTTRETVIRTFAEFKKQQILEGKGSRLVIRDMSRLREIAGPAPSTSVESHTFSKPGRSVAS
jgi:CRP/FNR family transcriptional regulator, cyclic AMP receptor protein